MRRWRSAVCALLLFCGALWALTSCALRRDYFPPVPHDEIPYSRMSREPMDTSPFHSMAAALEAALDSGAGDATALAEGITAMEDFIRRDAAVAAVLLNEMNANAADTAPDRLYVQCSRDVREMEATLVRLARRALEGPLGASVKALLDPALVGALERTPVSTEAQLRLLEQIDLLRMDYNTRANGVFTAEVGGRQYTVEELYALVLAGKLSLEAYRYYGGQALRRYNESLEDTFFALVETRQALARSYGYANYYEYAGKEIFCRDTDAAALEAFRASVAAHVPGILGDMEARSSRGPGTLWNNEEYRREDFSPAALTDSVGAYIRGLSPELGECFAYMERLSLWDLKNDGDRVPSSYNVAVDTYKPFIMNGTASCFGDAAGLLFHELGHANQTYHTDRPYRRLNYDLAEFHSMGLEMLSAPYYEETFGPGAGADMEAQLLGCALDNMRQGCLIDELERRIYTEGAASMEEISAWYAQLLHKYGVLPETDTRSEIYGWTRIGHLFLSPCYYISYALAAAAALELYVMSQTSFEKAVDAYLRVVANTGDRFGETLEAAGIPNVLEEDAVGALGNRLRGLWAQEGRTPASQK